MQTTIEVGHSMSEIDAEQAASSRRPEAIYEESGRLGRLVEKGGFLFSFGILAAAAILLSEVFLRYVFNAPTAWAHETTTFLCGISFLYGGLYCVSRNSHIRVVLIYDSLSPAWRRIMDVVISLVSCFACIFFSYAAAIMAKKGLYTPQGDFRLERSGSAWNPPAPAVVKVLLLLILILMAIQYLIIAFNYIQKIRTERRT